MNANVPEPVLVVDVGIETTMAHLVTGAAGDALRVPNPGFNKDYWPTALAREGGGFVAGFGAEVPGTEQGLPRGRFLRAARAGGPAALDDEVVLGGQARARKDLLGEFLRQVRSRANSEALPGVDRVLLTIPDAYAADDGARRGLFRAARIAGFTHVELLPAAVAAALASGRGGVVLVCDAGAGALRLTLVRAGSPAGMDPGSVLASVAVDGLGGDAMDAAMDADLRRKWQARYRGAPGGPPPGGDELARDVADYRILLSSQEQVSVTVEGQVVPYRRDDLERLMHAPLGQLRRAHEEALRRAGLPKAAVQPGGVLLVGGCAATPFLAGQLQKALRLKVTPAPEAAPELAVTRGGESWARHAPGRRVTAMPHRPGTRALAWNFKDGGKVRLITWLAREGEPFSAGDRLAVARDRGDGVRYLTAGFDGVLRQRCVREKQEVDSGQVAAVAETAGRAPADRWAQPGQVDDLPGATALAFSPDGAELLVARSGGCRLHALESTAERPVPWSAAAWAGPGAADGFRSDVAYGAEGWLAGVVEGGGVTVHVGRDRRPQPLGRYQDADDPLIRFAADGQRACVVHHGGLRVTAVPARKGDDELTIPAGELGLYGDAPSSVAYSGDGGTVLVAYRGRPGQERGLLRKKREPDVPPELLAWRGGSAAPVSVCELPPGPRDALCLAVSHDGGRAFVGSPGALRVFPVGAGKAWDIRIDGTVVTAAGFADDGRVLATAHWEADRYLARTWLWDGGRYNRLFKWDLGQPATRILFSPDQRYLVTGDDRHSTIWGLLP